MPAEYLRDPVSALAGRFVAIEQRLAAMERGLAAVTRHVPGGVLTVASQTDGDSVAIDVPDVAVVLATDSVRLTSTRSVLVLVAVADLTLGDAVTAHVGAARRAVGAASWSQVIPEPLPVATSRPVQVAAFDAAVPSGSWQWGLWIRAEGVSQSVATRPWWQITVLDMGEV